MNNKALKLFTSSEISPEYFSRIDSEFLLDIYLGLDFKGRSSLLFVSEEEPNNLGSTSLIEVEKGRRPDGKWALTFILTDESYLELFSCFCEDIIESSKFVKHKKNGLKFIVNRYLKWLKMLQRKKLNILSDQEIKGLIGELLFLKKYLFAKYGKKKALNSWVGPRKSDQDFIVDDAWYEVKTTFPKSDSVKISSINQLDSLDVGNLVVVYLDETSNEYAKKITLNSLVNDIRKSFENEDELEIFNDLLFDVGYSYNQEYDRYSFKFFNTVKYLVDETFPCLRLKDVGSAIKNIKYEIILNEIESYKKDIEIWN